MDVKLRGTVWTDEKRRRNSGNAIAAGILINNYEFVNIK